MGKHWTKQEREFFIREILPKSKYASGDLDDNGGGLDFSELAVLMQTEMDRRGQSQRQYTKEILFQHWYQSNKKRLAGDSTSEIYAPDRPGNANTQQSFGARMPLLARATPSARRESNGQDTSSHRYHSPMNGDSMIDAKPSSPANAASLNNESESGTLQLPVNEESIRGFPMLNSTADIRHPNTSENPFVQASYNKSNRTSHTSSINAPTMASQTNQRLDDPTKESIEARMGGNQVILGDVDISTTTKGNKRTAEGIEPDDIVESKVKKTKVETKVEKYKIGRVEPLTSDDPPSPSPAAIKAVKTRPRKIASAKTTDEEPPAPSKKPATATARKQTAAKKTEPIGSIESDNDLEDDFQVPKPKGRLAATRGRGSRAVRGGSNQGGRVRSASVRDAIDLDLSEDGIGESCEEEIERNNARDQAPPLIPVPSQHMQQPAQYQPQYQPVPARFGQPTVQGGHYGYAGALGPPGGYGYSGGFPPHPHHQMQPNPYGYPPPPYGPSGPYNYPPSGYLSYGMMSQGGPPMPLHTSGGYPYVQGVPPPNRAETSSNESRQASPQMHTGGVGYSTNANTALADRAGRPPRPRGLIYNHDGTRALVEECPCCRRGFEGQS